MQLAYKQIFEIVFVDLDGTLLNNNKEVGERDFKTLQHLGEIGITRVFATGRNLFSANKVLFDDSPFDYLVFSSGAGIIDWKTKKILFQSALPSKEVLCIERILKDLKLNFSIHFPVPENHKYYFHQANSMVSDFNHRNIIYQGFNYPLNGFYPLDFASQFLIIINHESEIKYISDKLDGFKLIRATSPLDGKSVWLEIFNTDVSKALGGQFICNLLNIPYSKTLGIGNDYNDLDLLDWAAHSFVVSNAPDEIKLKYRQCADNQNNPLTDTLARILN
jgi:Cof subfamily protein (haloacid dehalogenase superfamily)